MSIAEIRADDEPCERAEFRGCPRSQNWRVLF
jgi:hypothetical protein